MSLLTLIVRGICHRQVEVEWQLSGTWPLPYRPRVRVAGTTVMRIDAAHKGPQPRVLLMEER
jgi:hypothetical protein